MKIKLLNVRKGIGKVVSFVDVGFFGKDESTPLITYRSIPILKGGNSLYAIVDVPARNGEGKVQRRSKDQKPFIQVYFSQQVKDKIIELYSSYANSDPSVINNVNTSGKSSGMKSPKKVYSGGNKYSPKAKYTPTEDDIDPNVNTNDDEFELDEPGNNDEEEI